MRRRSPIRSLLLQIVWTAVICGCLITGPYAFAETEPSPEEIGPVQVLQAEDEALADIFGDVDSTVSGWLAVGPDLQARLAESLGRAIYDTVIAYYTVFADGEIAGWAVIADEKGKYRPITFMTGVSTDLHVIDVRVLVYRESRGGEVRRKRFLRQYRDKTVDDPLRINRDIINITGATISVHALNAGVRKALAFASEIATHGGGAAVGAP